jgi:hypothetical protein
MFDVLDPPHVDLEEEVRPLTEDEAQEEIEEVLGAWARETHAELDAMTYTQEQEARAEYEARRGVEEDLWARCMGTANADILYDSGL